MVSSGVVTGSLAMVRRRAVETTLLVVLAVAAGLSSTPSSADEAEDPAALIEAMSVALKTLNYEGTFVHMQGTSIRSMHILHSSNRHGELERMTSLDGEAREVIRNHMKVTCIFPGSDQVVVSKSKPRELLPSVNADLAGLQAYELILGDIDRVASREARIVDVRPVDRYRYGYRLWIDRETRMLLRYLLLDDRDMAIEQVLFSDIRYPERIDPARFEVEVDESKVTWVDVDDPAALGFTADAGSVEANESIPAVVKSEAIDTVDRVDFDSLPDGYREVSETYRSMPINTGPISHVMVSDGMASVSVYVEHVAIDEQDTSNDGIATMGAMNAYGKSLPEAYVTVVGEVPAATVMRIADAVIVKP